MPEPEYRRLTRTRNRTLFAVISTSKTSLWLGKDHLLQIDSSGYSESYKRFYFRDIQALVMCKTQVWLYQAIVLAAFACFFGLLPLLGGGPVLAWVFGSIAAVSGLCLVVHLAPGASAKCCLRTAVQTEALPSLGRFRRAQKVFETLRPLIAAAQGQAAPSIGSPAIESQPVPPVISDTPEVSSSPAGPTAPQSS